MGEAICDKIERLKWSLWHGQVDKALGKIDDLESAIEPFSETYARFLPLVKALSELRTYIVHNRHVIPHYGERYRHGEASVAEIRLALAGDRGENFSRSCVKQFTPNDALRELTMGVPSRVPARRSTIPS